MPLVVFGFLSMTILAFCVPYAAGCGSPYYYAVFTYSLYPDYSLADFTRGNLGVVNPGFARSYLYVAYRYLSNKPFDGEEQKALLKLWKERLNYRAHDEKTKSWIEARKAVPGSKYAYIGEYAPSPGEGNYYFFSNITPDAFRMAAETLKDRIKRFGAESQIVRDWLAAQDMVFSNPAKESKAEFASRKLGHALIPELPGPGLPALATADRDYQRACAHFYGGNFDQAMELFRLISKDTLSPWSKTARFMIVRCQLRKATLAFEDRIDPIAAGLAETELKKILKDGDMKEFHASANRLFAYLRLRSQPEGRLHELSQTLLQAGTKGTFFQDLWDYTVLLDRFEQPASMRDDDRKNVSNDFAARPEAVRKDDMTDWIFAFQSTSPKALDYALARWRQTRSLPWLVACLTKMRGNNSALADVLNASERVSSGAPGFITVTFHRVRLLAESGNRDKAREVIDRLISQNKSLSLSATNLLLAERAYLAKDLDDFLIYAPRKPAAIIYWNPDEEGEVPADIDKLKGLKNYKRGERLLDADAATILNRDFPLDLLKTIAVSKKIDANIRREIALRIWTRAALISRDGPGRDIVPLLEELAPEIDKKDLQAYVQAKDEEERRFASAYIMLKNPGLTPIMGAGLPRETPINQMGVYAYDDGRWWCANPSSDYEQNKSNSTQERAAKLGSPLRTLYLDRKVSAPSFLKEHEKQVSLKEWQTLSSLDAAPNLLTKWVLTWSQSHPDDLRVPEALHLAVNATRYGCVDKATTELSKKAFQMLHRRYPKSSWAAKTKHWY